MKVHVLLFVLGIAAALANGQIVDKGSRKAYTRIIIAPNSPSSVQLAASELKKYLKAVCNADLPLATDSTQKTGNIYVGLHPGLKGSVFALDALKPDGFRIINRDGNLYIWGRDYAGRPISGIRNPWRLCELYNAKLKLDAFGEGGTLYGIYYFLEKFAQVRWYMPGELGTVIIRKDQLEIPNINISRNPDFSYRHVFFCEFGQAPDDALWYRRAGFGGCYPVQIIHSFGFFAKYRQSHPEYFALVDGKRDFSNLCASTGGGNLCLSSNAVLQQWVDDICAYFKAHPEQRVFPLVPNDGLSRICGCPECQAQINHSAASSGRFSNYIWAFVDKVAREVAKKYPDKLIGCIAYEHYLDPPSNIRELSANVAVMICKWRSNFIVPRYKETMRKRIASWREKCRNIYFWEYYLQTRLPWRNLPVVFPHIISEDLKYMKKINCRGEFIESESWYANRAHKILFPGMQHLNLYITGKLYWDADQDVDRLLDEYFKLFYGPAAEEMKAFWSLAEKTWANAGKTKSALNPVAVFSKDILDQMSSLLESAAAKTGAGSVYSSRVKLIADEFKAGRRTILQVLRQSPPALSVPVTRTPILIDGALTEKTYKKLLPQIFVDKSGEMAAYRTYLYAAYDAKNLYFVFINYDPETEKLKSACTERDQNSIWHDDCIEIYLCPHPENRQDCYQFIINAGGVVWDAHYGSRKNLRPDVAWNSTIAATTSIRKNRWIMEVKIPLKDIGLTDTALPPFIAANFYHCRAASGTPVYSCWSPIVDARHFTPERFGMLKFIIDKK